MGLDLELGSSELRALLDPLASASTFSLGPGCGTWIFGTSAPSAKGPCKYRVLRTRDAPNRPARVSLPKLATSSYALADYMGRCARVVATYPSRSRVERVKRWRLAGTLVHGS